VLIPLPTLVFKFRQRSDPGIARIVPGQRLDIDSELRLCPVKDAGVVRLQPGNNLVEKEIVSHEH